MAGKKKSVKSAATLGLDSLAAQIAERWQASPQPLSIERISSEFSEVPRYDIVAALRALEKARRGAFMPARTGQKPLFVWNTAEPKPKGSGKRPVAPAAPVPTPQSATPVERKPNRATASTVLEHHFHVRSGFIATLALPTDVTAAEIERFCRFLQSLPFDSKA